MSGEKCVTDVRQRLANIIARGQVNADNDNYAVPMTLKDAKDIMRELDLALEREQRVAVGFAKYVLGEDPDADYSPDFAAFRASDSYPKEE